MTDVMCLRIVRDGLLYQQKEVSGQPTHSF